MERSMHRPIASMQNTFMRSEHDLVALTKPKPAPRIEP
jgi:hypothetical protein